VVVAVADVGLGHTRHCAEKGNGLGKPLGKRQAWICELELELETWKLAVPSASDLMLVRLALPVLVCENIPPDVPATPVMCHCHTCCSPDWQISF